nr:glycosyl hydrolase-related protein [Candidatus Sigynarchaeota archaeon]
HPFSILRMEASSNLVFLVFLAVKKAEREDALVARLFNPTKDRIQGTLRVSFGLARASMVNLNEEFVESLLDVNGTIDFSIKGGQILTFSLVPKRAVR